MIEATLHPADFVLDPCLGLSAKDQAEQWIVEQLAAAGFALEFQWVGKGGPSIAGRWTCEDLPDGAVRFRQWPAKIVMESTPGTRDILRIRFEQSDAYRAADEYRGWWL